MKIFKIHWIDEEFRCSRLSIVLAESEEAAQNVLETKEKNNREVREIYSVEEVITDKELVIITADENYAT